MRYEIQYDADRNCLLIHIQGTMEASELPGLASDLVALTERHKCERLLNDIREVELRLSTLDIYDIPELAIESGLSPRVRRALLVTSDQKESAFFETVSMNRGQNVRVFTDFDEAMSWLMGA